MAFTDPIRAKEYKHQWYTQNRERILSERAEMVREVMYWYGGKCQCCGEATIEFLTFDHYNNDGAEMRRKKIDGSNMAFNMYHSYKKPNLRLLCYNCNCAATRNHGTCPHNGLEGRTTSRTRMRNKVVEMYGGQCACCGLSDAYFLTLDHVNDDGHLHRKELSARYGKSSNLYKYVLVHGKTDRLALTCYNCNLSRSRTKNKCVHGGGEWRKLTP